MKEKPTLGSLFVPLLGTPEEFEYAQRLKRAESLAQAERQRIFDGPVCTRWRN